MNVRKVVVAWFVVSVGLLGCGEESANDDGIAPQVPVDAQTATTTIQSRLDSAFNGLASTGDAVSAENGVLRENTLTSSPTDCEGNPLGNVLGDGIDLSSLSEGIRDLSTGLKEHVFQQRFVESDDGMTVVYRLDPNEVCSTDNPECLQQLTANPVRFSVTSHADDTLRIAILVGEQRNNVGVVVLSDTSITLTVDLSEILSVLQRVTPIEDRDVLPRSLSGRLEAGIVKHAEQDFSLNFKVLETVHMAVAVGDSGGLLSVSLAQSPNAMEVRLNAVQQMVALSADWKAIDVQAPGSVFCGDSEDCGDQERQGTFALHFGGSSASTELQRGATSFKVTNVGLGDTQTKATLNNDPFITVDLNPNNNRRFDIDFARVPEGVRVGIEPKLDFRVAVMLGKLSEGLRADLPDWLMDEIFELSFGGPPRGEILIHNGCSSLSEGTAQVTVGSLHLAATSLPNDVVINAGMCIMEVETNVEDPHLFSEIAGGTCQPQTATAQ